MNRIKLYSLVAGMLILFVLLQLLVTSSRTKVGNPTPTLNPACVQLQQAGPAFEEEYYKYCK